MKKLWLSISAILLTLIVIGAACPAPAPPAPPPAPPPPKVYKWKMQGFLPITNPIAVHSQVYFTDTVRKLSGGRLDITAHGAGEIVPALKVSDAVSEGVLQMGLWWTAYDAGKDPAGNLFAVAPFTWSMENAMTWYWEAGGRALVQEFYDRLGMKIYVLGMFPDPYGVATHFKKPVATLEDMKGLKIRATGPHAEVLAAAGIAPVLIPGAEIYTALEKGVIDGAEFASTFLDFALGIHEVAKYMQIPAWHEPMRLTPFIVNKDAWKELPDDLKYICEVAMKATVTHYREKSLWLSAEAYDKMIKLGSKPMRLPDADLAKLHDVTQKILDGYAAKDPFYAKILKSQRDFLAFIAPYEALGRVEFKR